MPHSFRLLACAASLTALLPGGTVRALTVTAVTSDNGYPAHEVDWTDADGLPRSAVLVDQNPAAAPYTGYLRRYVYQVNGQTRTCTGTDNPAAGGNLEFSGDGFVQNHTADGGDFSSGNGAGVPGTTTITLQGSSHAVITFDMPAYAISGQAVPTTVQWFFADGRSHPVFAVSQDARATTGNLGSDTRTPYGDMAYDGDGTDALVGGFSYGDTFKFVTLAAAPEKVTAGSPWRDTEANTIPYTMQWANPAAIDAEMGHVATLPISLSDQGQDTQTSLFNDPPDLFDPRGKTGPALPAYNTYAFQIINYSLPDAGPTDSKRLAWGSNFGRVGGFDNYGDGTLDNKQYSQHTTDPIDSPLAGSRADGLLMAYSTFIVFGTHTGGYLTGTVGRTVTQMQNAAAATLAASVGTVVTSGPGGIGNAATATIVYQPPGYNPTYAAWQIDAAGNAVDATLIPAAGTTLDHPVFIISGYTAATPPVITPGPPGTGGTDFYATFDPANQRVFITANMVASSALHLQLGASGVANPTPTATPAPTSPPPTTTPPPLPTMTPPPPPTATPPPPPPILPTVAPDITSAANASGFLGGMFAFQVTADNAPLAFNLDGLPAGLVFNAVTGTVSGTPTVSGTFTVGVSATNAIGTGTGTLTLTITASAPKVKLVSGRQTGAAKVSFLAKRAGPGVVLSTKLKVKFRLVGDGAEIGGHTSTTGKIVFKPGMKKAAVEFDGIQGGSAATVELLLLPKSTYKVASPNSLILTLGD